MEKLNVDKINAQLKEVNNWHQDGDHIKRKMQFDDFKSTFAIMTRIAFEAESHGHHPELFNVYNNLEVSLSTHDAGGITQKDFELAKAIDQIVDVS